MNDAQYTAIITQLSAIQTEQEAFRRELLGNGQPGRIQRIESDLKELEDSRVRLAWKLGSITGGGAVILTLLTQWLEKLFK